MDMMNKAVTYARKSEEDKKRQIASISDQLYEAKKLAELHTTPSIKTFSEEKSGKISGVREARQIQFMFGRLTG